LARVAAFACAASIVIAALLALWAAARVSRSDPNQANHVGFDLESKRDAGAANELSSWRPGHKSRARPFVACLQSPRSIGRF
jgi:hypothetical protein